MTYQKTIIALLLVVLSMPSLSWATNGYFQHGIGIKEQSLGGAAIAYPQSALSVATNPASAMAVNRRFDVGIDWFNPHRSADNGDGSGYHESKCENFIIPQLGYSHPLNEKFSLAFVTYANGGMQTDWPTNFYGTTNTSSELEQMVIAPSLSYNLTSEHAVGISVNYIRQTFEARGLEFFASDTVSSSPEHVTNVGEDTSSGWGLRLGYSGQISPSFWVGAFWQPETEMDKFDDYRGLFARQGELDVPETYGVGIAVKLFDKLDVVADLVQINYSDVTALGNLNTKSEDKLGSNNGPGFGWKDVTVIKLGAAYQYTPDLTLRIGWNHGDNPVRSSQTSINVLSPATIEDHLTLGFSWNLSENAELSMTYWHGFENEVKGDLTAPVGAPDRANLKMYQDNLGIAYSWLFD